MVAVNKSEIVRKIFFKFGVIWFAMFSLVANVGHAKEVAFELTEKSKSSELIVTFDLIYTGELFDNAVMLVTEFSEKAKGGDRKKFEQFATSNIIFGKMDNAKVIEYAYRNYSSVKSIKPIAIFQSGEFTHLLVDYTLASGRVIAMRADLACNKSGCKISEKTVSQSLERLYGQYKLARKDKNFVNIPNEKFLLEKAGGISIYLESKGLVDSKLVDEFTLKYQEYYSKVMRTYDASSSQEYEKLLESELGLQRFSRDDAFLKVAWENLTPVITIAEMSVYRNTYKKLSDQPIILDYFVNKTVAYFLVSPPENSGKELYFIAYDMTNKILINERSSSVYKELNTPNLLELLLGYYSQK